MAQKIVIVDDLDAREGREIVADHSVSFTYDGITYLVDMTDAHRKEFEGAIAPYVNAANKTTGRPPRRTARRRPAAYYEGLRKWCAANGQPLKQDAQGAYDYPAGMRAAYDEYLQGNRGDDAL
jgi:hypothetical protein